MLLQQRYCVFFGSSLVALDEVPLPLPLGVAVEPLGWLALEPELAPELGELELVSLLELAALEPPPEAEPAFSLSFSASVVAELDELAAPGVEAPVDGLAALDDEELGALGLEALPPTEAEPDAEPDGGVDGVDDALLLEPEAPGALEARSRVLSPQAARPKASATAIANVESLMGSPGWVRKGTQQVTGRV